MGAAEVIFRARAADGREFPVSVEIEFDLTLAPPVVIADSPAHDGSDIMTAALDLIQNRIDLLVGQRIDPPELRMKVSTVLGDVRQCVVDLMKTGLALFLIEILHRDPAVLPERHLPETVHPAVRIDDDRKGVQQNQRPFRPALGKFHPRRTEKVADGHFHGRMFLTVPVNPQDHLPGDRGGKPHALNCAGTVDIRKLQRFSRLHVAAGAAFPAAAKLPRMFMRVRFGHRSRALPARRVLPADGAALRVRQTRKIAEIHPETVEIFHDLSPSFISVWSNSEILL